MPGIFALRFTRPDGPIVGFPTVPAADLAYADPNGRFWALGPGLQPIAFVQVGYASANCTGPAYLMEFVEPRFVFDTYDQLAQGSSPPFFVFPDSPPAALPNVTINSVLHIEQGAFLPHCLSGVPVQPPIIAVANLIQVFPPPSPTWTGLLRPVYTP